MIVKFLFDGKGISRPSYLDLGTNQPSWGNNTYLFYLCGSCGVCVEADESLTAEISRIRPRDKVLNLGVGFDLKTEADFYIFDQPAINTFDRDQALLRTESGVHKIIKVSRVKLEPISEIISKYCEGIPDFLSLDIEGLDYVALCSLDLGKFPIPVICVETCNYSEDFEKQKEKPIFIYMESAGYFPYADTYVNTIFVNKSWFSGRTTVQ